MDIVSGNVRERQRTNGTEGEIGLPDVFINKMDRHGEISVQAKRSS
jgi:hypothetical protein